MSDFRIAIPRDANGQSVSRAQGLPLVRDEIWLGSEKYVDIFNLEGDKFKNRAFIGIAIENPSASNEIWIAMGGPWEDEKDIVVTRSQLLAFDNLTYGPTVADFVHSGLKVTRIRARLANATGTLATGEIVYSANPTNGMLVEVGEFEFEFSDDASAAPGRVRVDIGADADESWTNFVSVVNQTEQAVTASIDTGTDTVLITSNYGGVTGNGFKVKDGSNPTGATFPVGDELSGGEGGVAPIFHIW